MTTLVLTRIIALLSVALVFPLATVAVFGFDADRQQVANVISYVYCFGLIAAVFAPLLPLASLKEWTQFQRVESVVLLFLGMSYFTHLSWELIWLLAHDAIIAAYDSPWAYSWWAYIDGGDARYASANPLIIAMEILSVSNGVAGMYALIRYLRSHRTDQFAVLIMCLTAVLHFYSASLYYLSEILEGMPNVDTTSFVSTWIKFGLANSLWVVTPWFVFWWAKKKLTP